MISLFRGAALLSLFAATIPIAAEAETLLSDDFEDGALAPWSVIQGDPNDAGVNDDTSQSGSQSLYVRFDTVEVATPVVDTSGPQTSISLWIRRGGDGFSNTPENGEDLELYYVDENGDRVLLDTFAGGGTAGETFTPSYSLPAAGSHPDFRLIARLTDSNGFDYWHIDDVNITQPDSPFVGNGTGLTGNYCNRGNGNFDTPCTNNPDVTRIDPTIEFANGDAGWPPSGIGDDTFSVRWTGQIQAQYTEDYTFHALHDDGVRIWVNGTQVIDQYSDQDDSWTDSGNPISLQRGDRYDIIIEYYENGGDQDMTLAWSGPSTPFRTPVPQSQLYPTSAPTANLLAEYRMDAPAWNGVSGEVTDESGNGRDGTAQGDATTGGTGPAIAGDPGTCRYGSFDGTNDAISVPNLSDTLNGTATLTFWIRTTQSGSDTGWQAPGVTGVEQQGDADDIFWGWIDASGRIGISVGDDYEDEQKSTTAVNDGSWHHVALTRDAASGETRVYVDGNLEQTGTSGTGTIGTPFSSIGRIEDTGGTPEYLAGELDEVRVYDGVLGEGEVQSIHSATHQCPSPPAAGSCAAVFPSAVQNTTTTGSVTFGFSTSVTDPDNLIETTALTDNSGGGSCGGTNCSATTPVAEQANLPSFESSSGNTDVDLPFNDDFAIGSDGNSDYDQVNVGFLSSLTDSGQFSTYRIDTLTFGFRSEWTITGGTDYYIGDLNADARVTIDVAGSGTARIFVRDPATFGNQAEINAGGDPERVVIVGYDDLTYATGPQGVVNALTYATGDVTLNNEQEVNGAIAAGGAVSLGSSNSRVNYDAGAVEDVDDRGLCPAPGPTVDHYAVLDPGQGLTCEALPVTVEARDSSGSPVDPSSGTTIDVSAVIPGGTNPAPDASWASSGSDRTSYTFGGGSSSATLQLRRTSSGSVNVDVDDGSATEIASADPDIPFAETGFLFYADGAVNAIGNQIAAKPSDVAPNSQSITLRAVEDPNGPTPGAACEARLTDDQTIEMGFECTDPDTCSGTRQVAVNDTGIPANDSGSVSDYGNVALDFGADGSAPLDLVYPDAGEIRLHAREELQASGDEPAVTLAGTSNRFIVRPFGFHVTASGNPGATTADGGVYRAAGTEFTATISAVGWSSADDDQTASDPDGVPDGYDNNDPTDNADLSDNMVLPNFGPESSDESATISSALYRPSGGNDPALDGTPNIAESAFEDGSDAGLGGGQTTLQYPEVGIIELRVALADGDYLGTGFDVPGRSVAVGRFIPADFNQTATDGTFRNTCAATFTYVGETFGYETAGAGGIPELTITARNAQEQTTRNYTDAFAKLVASDIARTGPGADSGQDGRDGSPLEVDSTLATGTLTDNGDGTLTYTFDDADGYRYLRNLDRDGNDENDALVAPFDSDLTITVDSIVDEDDVVAPDDNRENVRPDPVSLRFGRLVIENAAGAEIAPVEQVIRAEYFEVADGEQWTVNKEDAGCTALTLASPNHEIALSNDDDGASPVAGDSAIDVADGETAIQQSGPVALDEGQAILTFSPAGAENTGWVDTTVLLGPEHPYLAIDDDGDGVWDANPTGRVTFGIYTGPSGRILLREVPAN